MLALLSINYFTRILGQQLSSYFSSFLLFLCFFTSFSVSFFLHLSFFSLFFFYFFPCSSCPSSFFHSLSFVFLCNGTGWRKQPHPAFSSTHMMVGSDSLFSTLKWWCAQKSKNICEVKGLVFWQPHKNLSSEVIVFLQNSLIRYR